MEIINIGILAHVDAGKTTTVEQLLFHAGAIRQPGSVDKGSTQTDWLAIERQRGISVRASSTHLTHRNTQINIIDTPGHMDFIGEVERALTALDAVVLVLSAAEGIQSHTEILWRAARELGLPCLLFVNKIDRIGCDPDALLIQLRNEFCAQILPLNTCRDAGSSTCSVDMPSYNEDEIFLLCDADAVLAERFLSNEDISIEETQLSLQKSARRGAIIPLVYGSAMFGVGIVDLLEAICTCLPPASQESKAPLSGIVYHIEHDKSLGKIAHVRLFSGTAHTRDSVRLRHPLPEGLTGATEEIFEAKITQIRHSLGARRVDTTMVQAGDIAALCGLSEARAGDLIGEAMLHRGYQLARPVLTVQASAGTENRTTLLGAIAELADEDPLLSYEWAAEKQELHLRIMGQIQLDVLTFLLQERYKLNVTFSEPSVVYKETLLNSGIGYEAYTMPKPCWAVVKLFLEPLPLGSGVQFQNSIGSERLLPRYQSHIATSIPEALKQGRLGWEVTDLRISLIDGEHHLIHTHPLDFFLATPIAVQDGLAKCGSQLLEPILALRLTATENLAGKIIGDILSMRGEFDAPVYHQGQITTEALIPVATSMDYAARFAVLSSGKGLLYSRFHGYRPCPMELGRTAERRGVDPLDRAKWILHRRGALT